MLAPKGQGRLKVVRHVSSANFAVRGDGAFARAVAVAAGWIRSKNPLVGEDAESGAPFDIAGGGEHTARSIRQQFGEATIWAATLDDPDMNHPGRTWVTEITVVDRGGEAHFGATLFNVTRGTDEFFQPSIPGVVKDVIESIPSICDGRLLSTDAEVISSAEQVDRLVALMELETRRLPVIVLAEGRTRPEFADADIVARRVAGVAHVFRLGDEFAWELGRVLGRQLSVFDGAARIYAPGFRRDEADPFDHPLWYTRPGAPIHQHGNAVVKWALQSRSKGGEAFPRFEAVREAAAKMELKARREAGDEAELRPLWEEENERLAEELERLRTEHQHWLRDAEEERQVASRKIEQLKSDVARFRGRYEQIRGALERGDRNVSREPLEDLASFEAWVDRNIGPDLWLAPKAIRAVEKNFQFSQPRLIGEALYLLEEQYVAMKKEPGKERRLAYEQGLVQLGIEDTPCFVNRDDIRGYPAYSVMYGDEKRWCDRHLKYGAGADPRSMFRIYFCWNEDEQVVLIGHLPTHLDNNMTN
jgi:hypothetical protein